MSQGGVLTNIPEHYQIKYGLSYDLALQDTSSELREAVSYKPGSGERVTVNRLETLELTDYNERGGDTVNSDWDSQITSIFPQPADVSNRFDEWDEAYLHNISLPRSELSVSQAYAAQRRVSKFIVDAMTGPAYRGKNGTDVVPFDSDHIVPVNFGAIEGMSWEKIAYVAYMMDELEVPKEGRFLGFRAKQMADLVADIFDNHAANLTDVKMMTGTKVISEILGFKVLTSQRFNKDEATDIASAVAWQRDAVCLSMWADRKTYMDILPGKRHSLQVRTVINGGAGRKEDKAVFEILADESPST